MTPIQYTMTYSSDNISVDELTGRGLISVRAMNICKRSRLFTFTSIYQHYQAHGTFMMLPQMGGKTNQTLIELCCNAAPQLIKTGAAAQVSSAEMAIPAQPYAVIAAYQQIPEANRSAAEHIYGNLVCTLNRRVIRALFILYKSKSLAGLINGLQIKPSAFDLLTRTFLAKGIDISGFLDKLTCAISGEELTATVRDFKLNLLTQQLTQLTHAADERMTLFLKEQLSRLETGDFPISDFVSLLLRCDHSMKPIYRNTILTSDLFYRHGLPPSKELVKKLGIGGLKFRRLYQDNGQHSQVYNQISQGLKILRSQGLVTPSAFVLADAPYLFFTTDTPAIETPFTSRVLFPILSSLNPAYRMFCRIEKENQFVLFVSKVLESWFDTPSFFAIVEKKASLKIKLDDPYFLLQLLLPFCKHVPSETEQQQLFSFAKPLLLHLQMQQVQNGKSRAKREVAVGSRRQLIVQFITERNRHCHVDEIVEYLLHNGEQVPRKTLLKYLEKCTSLIKPLDGHLFQLREWDLQNKWQQETVLQLALNFLSAYREPKHIYTISRFIMKYKKVTMNVVTDTLLNYTDMHFSVVQKSYFGLMGKAYEKPLTANKKIPACWLDTIPFLFFSEPKKGIPKEELRSFMTHRYKLTVAAANNIIETRTRLGEWTEVEKGWLRLADEIMAGNSAQLMQAAI